MCPDHAQKTALKPWQHKRWVIPPQAKADVVYAMEDVLEVYTCPYHPRRPQVCVDETSKQLVAERECPSLPCPGSRLASTTSMSATHGTANLFMLFEPLAGHRWVKVTERRPAVDFAPVIQELVNVPYPEAEMLVLVMDNLNTHKLASL